MSLYCAIIVMLLGSVSPIFAAFSHPATSPARTAVAETLAGAGLAGMLIQNPATFSKLGRYAVEFAGQRLYDIPELDSYLAAASFTTGRFGFGLSFQSMGESDFYLESTFGAHVGYSPISALHLGLTTDINRIDVAEPYENISSISTCAGMLIYPFQEWFIYSAIRNPFESEIASGTRHRRELTAGISIVGIDDVAFAVEVSAIRGRDVRYKIGEEYRLTSRFSASGGIMTSPFVPSFGFTFKYGDFEMQYAYRYHSELGGTHIWGIAFSR